MATSKTKGARGTNIEYINNNMDGEENKKLTKKKY